MICVAFGITLVCSASKLLADMNTEESKARKRAEEGCEIPKLGGVVRVAKKVSLFERSDEASCFHCGYVELCVLACLAQQ